MHRFDFVAGDNSLIRGTVKNVKGKTPIDLTGATVLLMWRIDGGTKQTRTMTIGDPANGVVSYRFAAGELTAIPAGSTLTAEIEVTDAAGNRLTQLEARELKIRAKV